LPDDELPRLVPDLEHRHEPFPLTDVQQAYWFGRSSAFTLGKVAAHGYMETDAAGIDIARLNRAWCKLIDRHEMLRAIIREDGQQQILASVPPYGVATEDLRALDPTEREAALQHVRAQMEAQVRVADQWPLFEVRACRMTDQLTRVHFSFDILIGDASSLRIFARELEAFYRDDETQMAALEVSFRDYVVATTRLREAAAYQRARAYWLRRVPELPAAPRLPLSRSFESIDVPQFRRWNGRLEPAQWQALVSRAASAGVTPSCVLLTAFAETLALWADKPEFTINLTLFNRLPIHPQVDSAVGDFTSLTLLAVDSMAASSFQDKVKLVQKRLWEDLQHREFSGVEVLRELATLQGKSAAALMPVVFTSTLGVDDSKTPEAPFAWLGNTVYAVSQTPQVCLDHQIYEDSGALVYSWDVVEALFPSGCIDAMFETYQSALERLAAPDVEWGARCSPEIPSRQLAARAVANETAVGHSDQSLVGLVERQVRMRGAALAVRSATGHLTYGELWRRSGILARELVALGVREQSTVAVVLKKGWQQLVAALAVMRSRCAFVPCDPDWPEERTNYVLRHAECSVAITSRASMAGVGGDATAPLDMEAIEWSQPDAEVSSSEPGATDLAYIIYTSGSTGRPKGVAIEHGAVVNTILDINRRWGVDSSDSVLALSAMSFDLAIYDLFGVLAAGGTVVMPASEDLRDPSKWIELIHRYGISIWNSVPALLDMALETLDAKSKHLPLRLVLLSGDWIPVTLPDRVRAVCAPELRVISLGGATEASIWSIAFEIGRVEPEWQSIPYGKPLANQRFHVLDAQLRPRPEWAIGDLFIAGEGLAREYWNDGEKTAASFIRHPLTGERLYRTGDRGRYWPDGNIEFLGREDLQVKLHGHRIELGEIEAVLAKHPRVGGAVAAVARAESQQPRLVAYFVPLASGAGKLGGGAAISPEDFVASDGVELLVDPVQRLEFKMRHPGLRSFSDDHKYAQLFHARAPEQQRLRSSWRDYGQDAVPFDSLSRWLERIQAREHDGMLNYEYGSAGGLYPVQTYLAIRNGGVEGIEGGVYYYDPLGHRLVRLLAPSPVDGTFQAAVNREMAERAAFCVFLVAEMRAIEPMYGRKARDFCLIECGAVAQSLEEEAARCGIGTCQLGGLRRQRELREHLALSDSHEILHAMVGGVLPAGKESGSEQSSSASDLVDELGSLARQFLPSYMVPSAFIPLDRLPLSSNGKVDRRRLPQVLLTRNHRAAGEQPTSELEKQLASALEEVLGISGVGLHENFFELGANSLAVVRAHAKMKAKTGIVFPLLALFEHPTLRALSQALAAPAERREQAGEARARAGKQAAALLRQRDRKQGDR
jgi:amino acid adenylation domain-containing protein